MSFLPLGTLRDLKLSITGYRRFEFASIVYDEKSCLTDKETAKSNLDLI
jgi:hypothetical protein